MTIVIDTPAGINQFRLLAIAHALALEVNTGMKASRISALSVAQRSGLTTKRTKKGALADVIAAIQEADPAFTVDERTLGRALA